MHRDAVTIELPSLYGKQFDAIYSPARFALIEAGTKTGKTLGCAVWLVDRALTAPRGSLFWWIAPTYAQAKLGYDRMKALIPDDLRTCNQTQLAIDIRGAGRIECRSGEQPDNLYGAAVHGFVVDEASRLREEAWHAVRSTITQTRAHGRIIGNPKGTRNWFYRWGCRIKAGDDHEASYHALSSYDNPHLSRDEIEAAKRGLPAAVFAELYLGIAQADGSGVFRDVQSCVGSCLQPYRSEHAYAAGIDLARVADWTVCTILNRDTGGVASFDRMHRLAWERQEEILLSRLRTYGNAPAAVDSTGVGDRVLEALDSAGATVHGYVFTSPSKKTLVEGLMMAFERKEITIPEDKTLINELESFEYTVGNTGSVSYSAPDGSHDDCVMSLALAVWARSNLMASWTTGGY